MINNKNDLTPNMFENDEYYLVSDWIRFSKYKIIRSGGVHELDDWGNKTDKWIHPPEELIIPDENASYEIYNLQQNNKAAEYTISKLTEDFLKIATNEISVLDFVNTYGQLGHFAWYLNMKDYHFLNYRLHEYYPIPEYSFSRFFNIDYAETNNIIDNPLQNYIDYANGTESEKNTPIYEDNYNKRYIIDLRQKYSGNRHSFNYNEREFINSFRYRAEKINDTITIAKILKEQLDNWIDYIDNKTSDAPDGYKSINVSNIGLTCEYDFINGVPKIKYRVNYLVDAIKIFLITDIMKGDKKSYKRCKGCGKVIIERGKYCKGNKCTSKKRKENERNKLKEKIIGYFKQGMTIEDILNQYRNNTWVSRKRLTDIKESL